MRPLIDPRAGDVEDDISSPKRRSLAAVTGSLVAEISLAKLALALTALVVAPGLLLGVAPLVATGWLATLSGQLRADLGLLSLAVALALAVVGGFAGRRVLQAAERSFWSLNALAVQPFYAVFREVLRHLAEGVLSRGARRDRLMRVRAATAAVAGVLLSAAALAVVAATWPHTRWLGAVGDLATPLALIRPALANTVVILAGYLAAAALLWGSADAAMAQPRGRTPEPAPADVAGWRVAHLSDLHVVGERWGYRLETGRAGPRGNDRARRAFERLAAADRARPVDLVLVTGDLTDAGRSAEWAEFATLVEAHPGLAARTLILPGNHDVNVVDRSNPARLDLPTSPRRLLRRLRALSAIAAVQGARVHVVDPTTGGPGARLDDALGPWRAAITAFADTGTRARARDLARLWEEVFPLVLPPATPDGLGVALLNSNAETHFSFTNALGLVTTAQARRLERLLASRPRARWIVALHHHLVEYPRPAHALSERIGTVLVNGTGFLRRLAPYRARLVAMHGHRHLDWQGDCGGLRIISAPSPVMTAGAGGFYVHHLAPAPDGGLALFAPQWIALEAAAS